MDVPEPSKQSAYEHKFHYEDRTHSVSTLPRRVSINSRISYSVHRKPTQTGRYVQT